jgi:effector-binding domain-containing protein
MESKYKSELTFVLPDRLLWKLDAGELKAAFGIDGDVAWAEMMAPAARVKGDCREGILDYLLAYKIALIRPLLELPGAELSAEPLKDKGSHRVDLKLAGGRKFELTYVEKEGKTVPASVEGDSFDFEGKKVFSSVKYDTPKPFGPLTLPSVEDSRMIFDGKVQETVHNETKSIDWNPEVPKDYFAMPKPGPESTKAGVKKLAESKGVMLLHKGSYDTMGETIKKVTAVCREAGLPQVGPCRAIFLNDPGQIEDPSQLMTQVISPVAVMGPPPEKLPGGATLMTLPALEVASLMARGPYGKSDVQALGQLFAWAVANGYGVSGAPQILYYHSPETTVEEDLAFEVQIPVRKKQ